MRPIGEPAQLQIVMAILCAFLWGQARADTILFDSGAITATATVDLPLGVVSSCDSCLTTAPSLSTISAHVRVVPVDTKWLLRVNSVSGSVLRINGADCSIAGLPEGGSPIVRLLDLGALELDENYQADSLVITLLRCDD